MELAKADADVLLVGHTHLPFQAVYGACQVVNPESAGQPKHGSSQACCAVWEDGRFLMKSPPYRAVVTAGKLLALPIVECIARQLADVIVRGASPS